MFYLAALLVFLIDASIKQLILSNFSPVQSIPIIRDFLHVTYIRNSGVAFGLFQNSRPFLILIGFIVCAAVVYYYLKYCRKDAFMTVCLALILGGSLGNLCDRVLRGSVVDYIDFRFFPVFNFADVAINIGVLLIILQLLSRRTDASRNM